MIAERIAIFFLLRLIRSQGANSRTYIIFGSKENSDLLQRKISQTPWIGLVHSGTTENYDDLINQISEKHIDYVFIANAENKPELTRRAIAGLSD